MKYLSYFDPLQCNASKLYSQLLKGNDITVSSTIFMKHKNNKTNV